MQQTNRTENGRRPVLVLASAKGSKQPILLLHKVVRFLRLRLFYQRKTKRLTGHFIDTILAGHDADILASKLLTLSIIEQFTNVNKKVVLYPERRLNPDTISARLLAEAYQMYMDLHNSATNIAAFLAVIPSISICLPR